MSIKRNLILFVAVAVLLSLATAACAQPQVVEVEKIVEKEVVVTKEVEVEKEVVVTVVVEVEKEVEVIKEVEVEKEVIKEVSPKHVEITYWIFGSEGSAKQDDGELWSDFYGEVINEYEREHPGVDINFAIRGQESGGTTLYVDSAVAAGTPPDIYYDDIFRVRKYEQVGLLEPLNEALTPEDLAAYDPNILALMTNAQGEIYAIPCGVGYVSYTITRPCSRMPGLRICCPRIPTATGRRTSSWSVPGDQ